MVCGRFFAKLSPPARPVQNKVQPEMHPVSEPRALSRVACVLCGCRRNQTLALTRLTRADLSHSSRVLQPPSHSHVVPPPYPCDAFPLHIVLSKHSFVVCGVLCVPCLHCLCIALEHRFCTILTTFGHCPTLLEYPPMCGHNCPHTVPWSFLWVVSAVLVHSSIPVLCSSLSA